MSTLDLHEISTGAVISIDPVQPKIPSGLYFVGNALLPTGFDAPHPRENAGTSDSDSLGSGSPARDPQGVNVNASFDLPVLKLQDTKCDFYVKNARHERVEVHTLEKPLAVGRRLADGLYLFSLSVVVAKASVGQFDAGDVAQFYLSLTDSNFGSHCVKVALDNLATPNNDNWRLVGNSRKKNDVWVLHAATVRRHDDRVVCHVTLALTMLAEGENDVNIKRRPGRPKRACPYCDNPETPRVPRASQNPEATIAYFRQMMASE